MRDNLLDNHTEYSETTSKMHNAAPFSDLEAGVDKINKAPGKGVYDYLDSNAFEQRVEKWRTGCSLDDLWRKQDHYPVHFDELDIAPNLLAVDIANVLGCLDRFRFPHPIRQVLRHPTILHDREKIEAALAVAPSCSEDGRHWNRSLLAFLLLETAEDHCQWLWEKAHRIGEFDTDELPEPDEVRAILSTWIEKLGGIVMARADGRFLGPQWLLMKVRDERGQRAYQPHARDLRQSDLISWIVAGLSKAGVVSADIAALVELPATPTTGGEALPDGESPPPRLGALAMMELMGRRSRGKGTGDDVELLRRLDVLLANRDPGFEVESIFDSTSGLPASCCAYLLANTQKPSERWRQSWDLLAEQRRRTQHWLQTRDSDAFAPSSFLLTVGIAGMDWLCSKPHERFNAAGKLWREVFDATLECWLTISLANLVERIEARIGWLFEQHYLVFGNAAAISHGDADVVDINNDYSELLAKDLARLGGDDLMVATCCVRANLNGVTPTILANALKHTDRLDAVLDQFARWQELERAVRQRQELVDAVNEMHVEMNAIGRIA